MSNIMDRSSKTETEKKITIGFCNEKVSRDLGRMVLEK